MENQDKYKTTWDRKKKIDPITGKKISDLTFKEQREYNQRQFMPRSMTNQELRNYNNKPFDNPKKEQISKSMQDTKMLTSCLKAYLNNDEEQLKYYSDKTIELVKKLYECAVNNPSSNAMNQVWDRNDGKVKDIVDVRINMTELRPNQLESAELDSQFKEIPYQAAQIDSGDDLSKGIDKSIAEDTEGHSVEYMKSKDQCQ
jgi:hypothetical protein